LGNVKVVFNDYKEPVSGGSGSEKYDLNVLSLLNYYPFGMGMPGMGYEAGGSRYGFNGMEKDDVIKGVGNSYDFGGRNLYSSRLGRFGSPDPLERNFAWQSTYVFAANIPIRYIDEDGKGPGDRAFMAGLALASEKAYKAEIEAQTYLKNHPPTLTIEEAHIFLDAVGSLPIPIVAEVADGVNAVAYIIEGDLGNAAISTAALIPVVGEGGKISKYAVKYGDEAVGAFKESKKTYQTYTKTNPKTGKVYSGKTSGKNSPSKNVEKRDKYHHKNKEGYGKAKLDKSSSNPDAISGREQQNIEKYGGAKSQGGTSGNAINGISNKNKKKDTYIKASEKEFKKK